MSLQAMVIYDELFSFRVLTFFSFSIVQGIIYKIQYGVIKWFYGNFIRLDIGHGFKLISKEN